MESRRNVLVRFQRSLAEAIGRAAQGVESSELGVVNLLVALGGDGTLLAASRIASPHRTPILGIHVGGPASFGFLTETRPPHACEAIEQVIAGKLRVKSRLMVTVEVTRQDQSVGPFHRPERPGYPGAGADAQAARGGRGHVHRYLCRRWDHRRHADRVHGLQPGRGRAAGPPRCRDHPSHPDLPPHPQRPSLLVEVNHPIDVRLETGERDVTLLTVDGQVSFALEPGDDVRFQRSEQRACFVSPDSANFYQKVQARLRLGERFGS